MFKKKLSDESVSAEEHSQISAKIVAREKALLPIYAQISVQLADLHDRSSRMLGKGMTIKEYVLDMIEEQLKSNNKLEKVARLKSWMPTVDYEDDKEVAEWIEQNHEKLKERIGELKHEAARQKLAAALKEDCSGTLSIVKDLVSSLPELEKEKFLKSFK